MRLYLKIDLKRDILEIKIFSAIDVIKAFVSLEQ